MIARIAANLAFNRAPEHRWRQAAVPVAAAVFMLSILSVAGVLLLLQREADRVEQRTALLSTERSPEDLFLLIGDDVWRGQQFPVLWIDPAGSEASALPPGVSQLPKPGQAVVSPALSRLASENPSLMARYEDHLVIGQEGVRSGNELFAYVRVPQGRSLGAEDSTMRAESFGRPQTGPGASIALDFGYLPPQPLVAGVFAFLVVPGTIALIVGVSSASGVRDRRFAVLRWVGARGRTLATLAVIETLILALPGLVAATVLLGLVAPRLETVPFTGHETIRGDLRLPWWVLLGGLGVGLTVTAIASVVVATVRHYGRARPRPTSGRAVVTPLRVAPLCLGLAAMALGSALQGDAQANLKLAGIALAVVGVPLALPGMLRAVGGGLVRLGPVPASIAGRGLQWDPVRTSRPFLGVAALIVIALAGSGVISLVNHTEAPLVPDGVARTVTVEWPDAQRGDASRLASALGSGLVIPKREGQAHERGGEDHGAHGQGEGHSHGQATTVGATCPQLSEYFPGSECDRRAPLQMPEEMERKFVRVAALGPANARVDLVPANELIYTDTAVVLDTGPLAALEDRVRSAAMQNLPAPYVDSPLAAVYAPSELVPWLVGGIIVSAITLAIACLISLVDRLLGARKYHAHLLGLGVSPRRLTALEAWLFATPYAAVVVASFLIGILMCFLIVSPAVAMPWYGIVLTLGAAAVIGAAGTASMAFFRARSLQDVQKDATPIERPATVD